MLAGDGWGALSVELVLLVLDLLPASDLSRAALVCRRWQLLCYASHLWRCVSRSAPRTAEGRVRPRLRRRFFGKAVRGILIGSFPVSYTDKLNFLEAMFSEFNVEAMSAVYASYNGSMYKTINYLQSHTSSGGGGGGGGATNSHASASLTTSMPTTLAERALSPPVQASHVNDSRRGTVSRDWRHELKERASAFDEQSKLLLGAAATADTGAQTPASSAEPSSLSDSGTLANVSYFIARPVTSVYTLSANGYLAYELTHNPLLVALQQRTEFVDLVNILVEENCLLLVPQESTVRHLEISRHFIQHHIVVLDDAREPPAPTVARRRRRRLYSGPVEIELLNMLLSVDKDESETVNAPGVFDATLSPVKPSVKRDAGAVGAAGDDDVDDESSDGANKEDELERAVGLSTLEWRAWHDQSPAHVAARRRRRRRSRRRREAVPDCALSARGQSVDWRLGALARCRDLWPAAAPQPSVAASAGCRRRCGGGSGGGRRRRRRRRRQWRTRRRAGVARRAESRARGVGARRRAQLADKAHRAAGASHEEEDADERAAADVRGGRRERRDRLEHLEHDGGGGRRRSRRRPRHHWQRGVARAADAGAQGDAERAAAPGQSDDELGADAVFRASLSAADGQRQGGAREGRVLCDTAQAARRS
jgi:hypothetical protein